jgi:hypothetical protein
MTDMDMPDPSEPYGPDLEVVAMYLAGGASHAGAGMRVGRSAKFVQRALRDNPALRSRVQELKEERAAQAAAGLGAMLEGAMAAVRRGLMAEKASDQLRAASLVFDHFHRYRADSVAAERLQSLQAAVDELRRLMAGTGTGPAEVK